MLLNTKSVSNNRGCVSVFRVGEGGARGRNLVLLLSGPPAPLSLPLSFSLSLSLSFCFFASFLLSSSLCFLLSLRPCLTS